MKVWGGVCHEGVGGVGHEGVEWGGWSCRGGVGVGQNSNSKINNS